MSGVRLRLALLFGLGALVVAAIWIVRGDPTSLPVGRFGPGRHVTIKPPPPSPGFAAWVGGAGECLVRYSNSTSRPVLVGTYPWAFRVLSPDEDLDSTRDGPKVRPPRPEDWILVPAGGTHRWTVPVSRPQSGEGLRRSGRYTLLLTDVGAEIPPRLAAAKLQVVRPSDVIRIKSE